MQLPTPMHNRKETRMKRAEWWYATWESEWRLWRPSWSGFVRKTSRVDASAWQQRASDKRSGTIRAHHVVFCLCNIPLSRRVLIGRRTPFVDGHINQSFGLQWMSNQSAAARHD